MKKQFLKPIAAVMILAAVMMTSSACSAGQIKNIAKSIIKGQPTPEDEFLNEVESRALLSNDEDYIVFDSEYENVNMKYTVTRAYEISKLSDAGLSIDDYCSIDQPERYISSDGKPLDSSLTFLCVDMLIEQLSDPKTVYDGIPANTRWLMDMCIFSDDINYPISSDPTCFYLEQTEDITRSAEAKEYIYYTLEKGQTAHAKLCFLVEKDKIPSPDIKLYMGEKAVVKDNKADVLVCYIPLKVETVSDR